MSSSGIIGAPSNVINTIDGLQVIYATSIYDNGVLINAAGYVPYTNAVLAVNLNGQNLTNVSTFSTTGVNTLSGVASGSPSTYSSYLALNSSNQVVKTNVPLPITAVSTGVYYPTLNATAVSGNVNLLYVDSTAGLSYSPATGTLTATYFSGTATQATNSTNAANANLVQATTGTIYLVGSSNYTTGYYTLSSQNSLTYAPATGTVTATTFAGNASTATNAYQNYQSSSYAGAFNLLGTAYGASGNYPILSQNLLYYNVSTQTLYSIVASHTNLILTGISTGTPVSYLGLDSGNNVVKVTGGITAGLVTTTGISSASSYFLTFVATNSTSPTALAYNTAATAGSLTYNPSTNYLNTPNLSLSNITAGTIATYIGLNTSNQVVSYTPTTPIPTQLITTGTTLNNAFYITFTTTQSTTPTASTYYTDATAFPNPLTYYPHQQLLSVSNISTNLVQGNTGTSLVLNSLVGTSMNFQIAATNYMQLFSTYLYLSNGLNTIQTSSQTLLQVAGANSATAATNFNFENLTPYATLTTGTNAVSLTCSNATLGAVVASSNNTSSAGSSQLSLQILSPSGVSGSPGLLTPYALLNNTGVSLATFAYTNSITSASYNATTLLLTINYGFALVNAPAIGSWVSVAGLSISGLNGTYIVLTTTSTSFVVQNYYGIATSITTSGAQFTLLSPASRGYVFGDSTYKTTNQPPIVTFINRNTAVAGTPVASYGYYTPPAGCKYLKVRMVGAGAGGTNYNTSPYGGIGGSTTFNSYTAVGGNAGVPAGAYFSNSAYPYLYFAGGLGGGIYPIVYASPFAGSAAVWLNFSQVVSSTFATSMINVGSTVYLYGFSPVTWNGAFTVTFVSSQYLTIATSGTLPAIAMWGFLTTTPPDNNTTIMAGGQGGAAYYNSAVAGGGEGGASVFGGCSPSFGYGLNPYGFPANSPSLYSGMATYGGGGRGSSGVGTNIGGGGGGAGQYVETYISNPNPLVQYGFTVGAGGLGGGGDAGARYASSAGSNGLIIVEAFF